MEVPLKSYTMDEVSKHRSDDDKWIVVDQNVYDVSSWQYIHPGGSRVIGYYAGQDASDIFRAMHTDQQLARSYLKHLKIGQLQSENNNNGENKILATHAAAVTTTEPAKQTMQAHRDTGHHTQGATLEQEFRELRQHAEEAGLFKASPVFYTVHIAQFLVFEILAYLLVQWYGANLMTFSLTAILLTTSQIQCGWTQHDFGHSSVLPSTRLNRIVHQLLMGHFKGASSHWWRYRHFRHHARPNCASKDPDVRHEFVFLVDEQTAEIYGRNRWGYLPYDWQHIYFWFLGPPTLLTFYFQLENLYVVLKNREWLELFLIITFFARVSWCYVPVFGVPVALILYMVIRALEGYWLVLVTQANHIPMNFNHDWKVDDFVSSQGLTTCNMEHSVFNDWFTGHINFHIEHHLFPTMPRHNYVKVAPLVKSLFHKHHVPYVEKPLLSSIMDIVRKLKVCGRIWREAYTKSKTSLKHSSSSNSSPTTTDHFAVSESVGTRPLRSTGSR